MKNGFGSDNEYITKTEMAARMHVSPRTIDAWMTKGLVPYRKIGRTVRFDWRMCQAEPEVATLRLHPHKV